MKGQKIKELYFGGDYNPDQWDEATIRKDMEYFKKCHINYVALPVFSWAKLEPEDTEKEQLPLRSRWHFGTKTIRGLWHGM